MGKSLIIKGADFSQNGILVFQEEWNLYAQNAFLFNADISEEDVPAGNYHLGDILSRNKTGWDVYNLVLNNAFLNNLFDSYDINISSYTYRGTGSIYIALLDSDDKLLFIKKRSIAGTSSVPSQLITKESFPTLKSIYITVKNDIENNIPTISYIEKQGV